MSGREAPALELAPISVMARQSTNYSGKAMKPNRIVFLAAALIPLAVAAQTPTIDTAPQVKSSFKAFAASFSPSGDAALHLLQTFLNCPNSDVAQAIDSTVVSTVVLYETMGQYRPTPEESRTLSKEDFRRRVLLGITQIQGVDSTDVATSVDCSVSQEQIEAWVAKLDTRGEGFVQFRKRLATFPEDSAKGP